MGKDFSVMTMARLTFILALIFISDAMLFFFRNDVYGESTARGHDVEARLCIEKWKRNLAAYKPVKFSSSFVDWIEYEDGTKSEDNHLSVEWVVDFVNKRFWKGASKQDNDKDVSESLITEKRALFVSEYTMDGQPEFDVVSYIKVDDGLWGDSLALLYWGYPFGYVESGNIRIFLPDILESVSNLNYSYKDGCPVLHCISPDYIITAVFNSDECQFVKSLEIKRIAKASSPYIFQECKYIVDQVEEFDGIYLPIKYRVEEKKNGKKADTNRNAYLGIESSDVLPRTLKAEAKLEKISFPKSMSESDFEITIPIPNGTPVSMQDAPQIDYIWMDGKPVVKTDEVALRIARGDHGFMPGPKNPRLWFMILGAVLLLVGGGLKIRTMLRAV